ncbi:MAG: transposase [Erysipelotrichaceae bacterium]|nr:transposase [Erysipelotrichaceae bacterium]
MGRPKGGKNRKYPYEFKLKAVKTYLNEHRSFRSVAAELNIAEARVRAWVKLYNEGLLETGRKRPGNPFSALHTSKSLSKEERLELENLKLKIENERLKKGYLVKGGGVNKEYVTIFAANTRS